MTREEIIAAKPLARFLEDRGYDLRPAGANFVTNACPATLHKDYHRPVTIDTEKNVWHCNDCKIGGSVIDWVMAEQNISAAEAMHILGGGRNGEVMVATYDYTDVNGKLLYQVCRFEPKDFRQRRPDGHGGWIWNTQGVRRVLYNLPTVFAAQCVVVVEGEKDCDRVTALGFTATTNVGGAGKWRDEYSEVLRGKDVIVFGDVGDPKGEGERHTEQVIESLTGKAKSIKHPQLPEGFHDISDLIAAQPAKTAKQVVEKLIAATPIVPLPTDSEWATDLTSFTSLDEARFPAPLEDAAYYGLAGKIVRRIQPETEAHPAALLTNLLAGFGNLIGRNGLAAHATADGVRHYCNIFTVTVGPTSTARKGTAWKRTRPVLAMIDADWSKDNIESGLSSGEGVIHRIRNKIEETKPIRNKGRYTGEYETVTTDPGVDDKRLLIVETEFCSALKVMNREGNTLSPVLRAAWDGDDLGTLTKHSRERATDPHVSLIGHITREELRRNLNETEAANGFGNRQLWIAVRRWQNLPKGGDLPAIADFLDPLGDALLFAQTCGELRRDDEAEELWARVYPELSEGKPGLLGAITARAAPQTLRLSVIYAVLDCSPLISVSHLQAALAVWRYSEASARWIFETGTGSKVGDRIVAALIAAGGTGLTKTQIICDVFNRNVTKFSIDEALRLIHRLGLAVRQQQSTKGRPSERWFFKEGDESNELNEQREGLCR